MWSVQGSKAMGKGRGVEGRGGRMRKLWKSHALTVTVTGVEMVVDSVDNILYPER